jgi:hypothetical protein
MYRVHQMHMLKCIKVHDYNIWIKGVNRLNVAIMIAYAVKKKKKKMSLHLINTLSYAFSHTCAFVIKISYAGDATRSWFTISDTQM